MQTSQNVETSMAEVLADAFTLMIMTQDLHWNYTGHAFFALHTMSQDHYEKIFTTIDTIAEHMRAKNWHVPAGLGQYAKLSTIEFDQKTMTAHDEQIRTLIDAYDKARVGLERLVEHAQTAKDIDTEDLAIEIMRSFDKQRWMLNASLT